MVQIFCDISVISQPPIIIHFLLSCMDFLNSQDKIPGRGPRNAFGTKKNETDRILFPHGCSPRLALCSAPYPSPISSILFPSRLSFPEKVPTCSEKDIASRSPMTMAMEPGDGPHCANAIQQLRGTALCSGNGLSFRGSALASSPRNCSIRGDSFDALESKLESP